MCFEGVEKKIKINYKGCKAMYVEGVKISSKYILTHFCSQLDGFSIQKNF